MGLNSVGYQPSFNADSVQEQEYAAMQSQAKAQAQAQQQEQIPAASIETATVPSGLSGGAIATGALLGAAGGGAIGAYGMPSLKYKDLEELAKSGELGKTLEALPKETPEKAKKLTELYEGAKKEKGSFESLWDATGRKKSITVDEYKKDVGYSMYDDVFKADDGIEKLLTNNKGKTMTADKFFDDLIKAQFGENHKLTEAQINTIKTKLGEDLGQLINNTELTDDVIKNINKVRTEGFADAREIKQSMDDIIKNAKDGKITKAAMVEHQTNSLLAQNVKNLADGDKKEAFEAIKKYSPKNRMKPGLIGAAIGALAAGAAIYAYSQSAKKAQA